VGQRRGALGQRNRDVDRSDAIAAALVALEAPGRARAHFAEILLEFRFQTEYQAGGEAVRHRRGHQARGIRPAPCAERLGLVERELRDPGPIEAHAELEARLLLEGDGEALCVGHCRTLRDTGHGAFDPRQTPPRDKMHRSE